MEREQMPLVILVGPTAVGKTAASIRLAKELDGEIISGDSMQIYRGLDIGTAKITPEEMDGVPHHLIDIKSPKEGFSVAEFKVLADAAIADVLSRGKMPLLVGGTGLYINSVLYSYHFGEAFTDEAFRQEMMQFAMQHGNEALYQRLVEVDKEAAWRLHPNDRKRIIRALEIHHLTGKPASQLKQQVDRGRKRYQAVYLALDMDRAQLYQRIEQRVDRMMEDGLLEETKRVLADKTPVDALSMTSLGYRQMVQYLQGEIPLEKAVALIKRDTRHFAKRQLTWFRHDPNLIWIKTDQKDEEAIQQELLKAVYDHFEIMEY